MKFSCLQNAQIGPPCEYKVREQVESLRFQTGLIKAIYIYLKILKLFQIKIFTFKSTIVRTTAQ
jgi:hypothetical protein